MSILKEQRLKKGITTYQLQKAGLGVKTYTAIENGGNYTKKSLEKYMALIT